MDFRFVTRKEYEEEMVRLSARRDPDHTWSQEQEDEYELLADEYLKFCDVEDNHV